VAYPPSEAAFPVPQGAVRERVDPVTGQPSATGVEEIMRVTAAAVTAEGTPGPAAPAD
jgi:hypothetical protein